MPQPTRPDNSRRATPEKVLFVFAAFLFLAALAGLPRCAPRERIEWHPAGP